MDAVAFTPYSHTRIQHHPRFGQNHHQLPPHSYLITDVSNLDPMQLDQLDLSSNAAVQDGEWTHQYDDIPPCPSVPYFAPFGISPFITAPYNNVDSMGNAPSRPTSWLRTIGNAAQLALSGYGAYSLTRGICSKVALHNIPKLTY